MGTTASFPMPEVAAKAALQFDDFELRGILPRLTDEEFEALCRENPELRLEMDKDGNLIIMPPSSLESGSSEIEVGVDLGLWNRHTKLGKVFSSQAMFTLPDGAKRMPDAAWMTHERWATLSPKERQSFAHVVPDFVIEVSSPTDNLKKLKAKMRDVWIANGVRLAWLLDPPTRTAWVFRADGSAAVIEPPAHLISGEYVLPGFEFDLNIFSE